VDIVKEDSDYTIIMTQGSVEISPPIAEEQQTEIMKALGLDTGDLDERCPVQIASTGHSKVMVGIKKRETLNALQPDMMRLTGLSKIIDCNGYFVFTFDSDSEDILTHGRMFAPAIGIPEDPVTGNAHGPLGAYLVHHQILSTSDGTVTFRGKQGEAIGRPGIVTVSVEVRKRQPVKVQVAGNATIVFTTEIVI
jgi:PhzF family phenazine biosynthesis protein